MNTSTKKRKTYPYLKALKFANSLISDLENIYMNGGRFMWDSGTINEARINATYKHSEWKRLPQYMQSYVAGAEYLLNKQHQKLVEYSYEINGVRLLISSDEYRKISPEVVHKLWSHTGALSYKADPNKIYYSYDDSKSPEVDPELKDN